MTLVVACQCGQRFAANPQYAGKTLPCPACGRPLAVPPLETAPAQAPVSAGLPPYQSTVGHGAGSGGLSTNAKLLIGAAAGGTLLLVCVVVGVLVLVANSGKKQIAPTAYGPHAGLPGYGPGAPGYGPGAPGYGSWPYGPGYQPPGQYGPPPGTPGYGPGFTPPQPHRSPALPPPTTGAPAYTPNSPMNREPGTAHHRSPFSKKDSTTANGGGPTLSGKTTVYSLPGKFSISVPVEVILQNPAEEQLGGRATLTVAGKLSSGYGVYNTRLIDIPQATNTQRQQLLEGIVEDIQNLARSTGKTAAEIKGLETTGKIPDAVEYSYVLQKPGDNRIGGGRLVFGPKRVAVGAFHCKNAADAQILKAALRTYKAL